MTQISKPAPARTISLTVAIEINAPKARVWSAMVDEIDAWWLPQHRMAHDSKKMILEPRPGGRFYEDAPGGGLLWYTIQMIVPGESLDMHGYLATRYGGPAISLLHVALSETRDTTTVTITDSIVGAFSDEMGSQTHTGWTELFGAGLKPYVEGTKK